MRAKYNLRRIAIAIHRCDPFLDHSQSKNASKYLGNALQQGIVTLEQLQSAIARVMLTRFKLGEFDEAPGRPYAHVDETLLDSPAHRAMAREAAAASVVMAHNRCTQEGYRRCTLPLSSGGAATADPSPDTTDTPGTTGTPHTIAVIGPFTNCSGTAAAGWSRTNCYLHSYAGIPSKVVSILDGITGAAAAHGGMSVVYSEGTADLTNISSTGIADAARVARTASVTVLGVGTGSNVEKEGKDRTTLGLPDVQQELLAAVHAAVREAGGKLVVVVVSAGPVVIDPAAADAILYAGYGGEEAGNGVADVLFGAVSPSARFPVTVYEEDYLSKVGPISDYSTTSGVGQCLKITGNLFHPNRESCSRTLVGCFVPAPFASKGRGNPSVQ